MTAVIKVVLAALATACGVAAWPASAGPRGSTQGVSNALLAQTARTTPVGDIDYDQDRCDDRTVEQWITALAGANARSIAWTGGPCQIVGPGIDSGSRWCAQATITLVRPQSRDDRPMIEVFFEAPADGKPGKPYAFRGAMIAADGGDTMRFRKDFEADWTSRFPAPAGSIVDCAE